MGRTSIEWTDVSWPVINGCRRISPGCGCPSGGGCYAERLTATRLRHLPKYKGLAVMTPSGPRWTGEARLWVPDLDMPLKLRKPSRIFVCDMGDLFYEEVTNEEIAAVFGIMAACPQHSFQVLTKRPKRMREWFALPGISEQVDRFRHIAIAGRIGEYFSDEREAPIDGCPGYWITSRGRVLTENGSESCLWCGAALIGTARRRYCNATCRTKADYEGRMGRWSPPPGTRREMEPEEQDGGYQRVMLYRGENGAESQRFLVHRMVLSAFDGPRGEEMQACHVDGNPRNNALWNLRWGSQEENWSDSKRHGTARRYSKLDADQVAAIRELHVVGQSYEEIGRRFNVSGTQIRNIVSGRHWPPPCRPQWPLPGLWLGVSVENRATLHRLDDLLATPAAVHFASFEPLLEDLGDLTSWLAPRCSGCIGDFGESGCDGDHPRLSWAIIGGESGPHARPFDLAWARSIIAQCKAAGTACFLKQFGARPTSTNRMDGYGMSHYGELKLRDYKGGEPGEWACDLRVREFPAAAEARRG